MRRPRLLLHHVVLLVMAIGFARGETLPWHPEAGYRWAGLAPQPQAKTGFTLLPPAQTGITFTNALDEMASAANRILLNGAGLATGDFDQDGLPDIFFCSLSGHSALYRNLGKLRFAEVTASSGIHLENVITRGAVFADLNGDGWPDLLVSTLGHGVACFLNDGHGKFTDSTRTAGTSSPYGSVTMALADVDGNGTLDLYVSNYRSEDIRDRGQVDLYMVRGQMVVPPKLKDRFLVAGGQVLEYGEPDQLLLNDGKAHFTSLSWTNGAFLDEDGRKLTGPALDWGLTATFRDINEDGFPDLYVCNDYWTPDRIWINDGVGHFRALPRLALRATSSSSMGVDFADIDRDGHLDFIVTDMLSRDLHLRKRQMPARWPLPDPPKEIEHRVQIIQNTLLHNRGDGTFEEIANYAGVPASEWTWQPLFLDVDLDGYPDLLVTAGHSRDVQDMDAERAIRSRQHSWKGFTNAVEKQKAFTQELMVHMRLYPRLEMPIFAFRNTGGLKFEENTAAWGTGQLGVHHCMALADFDNDGDLDLVVNNLNSVATLFRNDTSAPRVAVRLKGTAPNTEGVGARVQLLHGAIPVQESEMIAGGRYMSGSDPELVFAAGKTQRDMTLVVKWRSGGVSEIKQVSANRLYEVDEAGAGSAERGAGGAEQGGKAKGETLFKDVSATIRHVHQDEPFDDFARQPLLPKQLSQLGPGVAWCDVDGDGWDDLVIGSGRGGRLAVYLNDQHGGFKPLAEPPVTLPVTRDQTAVLGTTGPDSKPLLLAGSSNYEDGLAAGAAVRLYDLARKRIDDGLPGQPSSTGPLALADLDGDGSLDLFIGGRCIPGRYPEPASSLILRQKDGRWQIDDENSRALRNVGLVSGAVWTDLDGDGFPELALACEWGPVRVFKNESGRLREATAELGLDKFTGWWSGITAGDLDGDGKPDLVVGNWGLNSAYQTSAAQPLRLYYGDLAGRGMVDLIEAEYDPALKEYAPRRRIDVMAAVFPFLLGRFPTAKAFSEAGMTGVLGPGRSEVRWVEANTLASTAFLNRSSHLEPVPLPREAQFSPVFGIAVADFDGDGAEDVFLGQNFFDLEPETPRQDAGRGLVLLGDGKGGLRPLPGQISGIEVYGEQRGAAVADFDGDGRADLAVTQNNAATRLFRNTGARPGLRVHLSGPAGNPTAVGAVMRLVFAAGAGPVREVHGGSGYWSQDSAAQVLATPQDPQQLWIRWPGGKVTTSPLPPNARDVVVDPAGGITTRK